VQDNDAPSLQECLSHVYDKETKATLLKHAVRLDRYDCIRVLIAAGSDPFLRLNGVNAVMCAIHQNDIKALPFLVDQQLPADVVSEKPVSRAWYDDRKPADAALFIAAGLANVEAVNVLLEFGASPIACFFYDKLIDESFDARCSALVAACLAPSRRPAADNELADAEAVVQALVNAGANVNSRCSTGLTPLHCAVESGLLEAVVLLVEAGADVNAQRGTYDGLTPLMRAAHLKSDLGLSAVTALLSVGADIDLTDRFGRTALDHAVHTNNLPVAECLLQQGANPNGYGALSIPLYSATSIGNHAMVILLLKWGVHLTGKIALSRGTVFDVALRVNNFELVSVFLVAGFDHARAYKVVCENIDAIYSKVPVGMTDLLSLDDRIRLQHLQKLHGELSQPQTLKQLCRVAIRRYVLSPRQLRDLPLLSALQSFLSLDDL